MLRRPQQAHHADTELEYMARALAFGTRNRLFDTLVHREERPPAYVNRGRWVVDCRCGNGASASPEWELAICFECGAVYRPRFPARAATGEAILLARPAIVTRNWHPDELVTSRRSGGAESVLDLARENRRHGLGVR